MRNFILSLTLSLFSLPLFAADYYWAFEGYHVRYSSAVAACRDAVESMDTENPYTYKEFGFTSEVHYMCLAVDETHLFRQTAYITVTRHGETCPPDTTYNSLTGGCDAPKTNKCEGRAGQQRTFQKSGIIGDGWFSVTDNGFGVHPQDNCVEGCQAWTEGVKCTYNNLVGNLYRCRGTANLTGAECGTSGADAEETDDKTLPEPQRVVDKKPCVYKTNSDGTQTCQSESSESKDGQHCGEVNGVRKCIDETPSKNGIDITTNVKTEPTPDGGSKTTKTDVTTKTECKNGKCSSSTTTRETTTTKDSTGKTISVSGKCTGKDCKDKNEDPDGNGNGNGTCTGANCGNDPFGGDGSGPELGDVDDYGKTLTGYYGRIKNAPMVAAIGNLTIPSGGSCPTYTATIEYIGSVSTQGACNIATSVLDPLRLIFLAIWAIAAIRVLMSA